MRVINSKPNIRKRYKDIINKLYTIKTNKIAVMEDRLPDQYVKDMNIVDDINIDFSMEGVSDIIDSIERESVNELVTRRLNILAIAKLIDDGYSVSISSEDDVVKLLDDITELMNDYIDELNIGIDDVTLELLDKLRKTILTNNHKLIVKTETDKLSDPFNDGVKFLDVKTNIISDNKNESNEYIATSSIGDWG